MYSLHVLKLLHPRFGVTLADLAQGLILVAPFFHVLLVQNVQLCLLGCVP